MGAAVDISGGTGVLDRWMSASAAVVGRSHERTGVGCQDCVGESQSNGVTAIALADGAGSAAQSEAGAMIAVAATLDLLTSTFASLMTSEPEELRSLIVDAVLSRLHKQAGTAPIGDFAATLAFVAIGQGNFVAGHLGDGIVACERNGVSMVLSAPQRGEHVNETTFITSRSAKNQIALWRGDVADVTAFALMSDGTAESLYLRREKQLAAAVTSLWRWLDTKPPATVRDALALNLQGPLREATGDDCSLAMLRRVQVAPAALATRDATFAQVFLGCRSRRSLRTRLAVLAALESASPSPGIASICARTQLSATTVRAHAHALKALRRETVPSAETEPSPTLR